MVVDVDLSSVFRTGLTLPGAKTYFLRFGPYQTQEVPVYQHHAVSDFIPVACYLVGQCDVPLGSACGADLGEAYRGYRALCGSGRRVRLAEPGDFG